MFIWFRNESVVKVVKAFRKVRAFLKHLAVLIETVKLIEVTNDARSRRIFLDWLDNVRSGKEGNDKQQRNISHFVVSVGF